MKLVELLESEAPVMFEDFILENCKPYMQALDADMDVIHSPRFSLYRGMKPEKLSAGIDMVLDDRVITGYVKQVRSDRLPKDTPQEISDIVNDVLEEKFGWRPRSESMFCYTYKNRGGVQLYGERYRVFPMGDLEFVYSPKVRDLTFQLAGWMREQGTWPGHGVKIKPENRENVESSIRAFIREHGYTNKNLYAAMMADGKPEIMVNCHKYLAIAASYD